MVSSKTLVTNVRLALQQAHTAWTLIDQSIGQQNAVTRFAYAKALTELRDGLAITFADRKLASVFRETVKAKHPHLVTLVTGYKQELEKLQTWLKVHKEEDIQKTIHEHKNHLEHIVEDARKASPAMFNHLGALEGLIREAKKEGLNSPREVLESAPGLWLEYVEHLEQKVQQLSIKSTWFSRFGGGPKGLLKEAEMIEKRSREGWPTIILHAKQSLSLQQRLLSQQRLLQKQIDDVIATLSMHGQYSERLADLLGMGEEGYVMAHADDKSALELSQCLDTSLVGDAVAITWDKFQRMKNHEKNMRAVASALLDWTNEFTKIEKRIAVDEKYATSPKSDEVCAGVHEACTIVRRTVSTIQQWLTAMAEASDASEGLLDSIYTDAHMRNIVFQSQHTVAESLRIYQNA